MLMRVKNVTSAKGSETVSLHACGKFQANIVQPNSTCLREYRDRGKQGLRSSLNIGVYVFRITDAEVHVSSVEFLLAINRLQLWT